MTLAKTFSDYEKIENRMLYRLTVGLARAAGFIRKDMAIAISYKLQFIFQFSQVFFSVAIIYFIGKMLGNSGKSPLLEAYGADYFSFALVGLAVASYLKTGLVTITNESLLAGTMFPIAVLPDWLRAVAFCLPLTHSLEAMRKCLLMGASVWQVYHHLLALLIFMAALLPVTVVVNNICMGRAKRKGAFSTH